MKKRVKREYKRRVGECAVKQNKEANLCANSRLLYAFGLNVDDESRKESHSSASESRCSRPVTTALSCCCSAISRSVDGTGGGVFGIVDENVLLKFTDAKVRVYLCVCV